MTRVSGRIAMRDMAVKSKSSNGTGVQGNMRSDPDSSVQVAVAAIKRDLVLSLATRVGLAIFGFGAAITAVVYVLGHANEITTEEGSGLDGERLVAFLLPPALLVLLAVAAGVAAWAVHSRNLDETYRALDAASRMWREAQVAVSARGLVHSFEEKLASIHRAFTLLLWFGRTLFLVSLGLFFLAVVNAIVRGEVDVYTAILGGTSLVGVVVGFLRNVPGKVKRDLADVVQIQAIVTGFHRQVSLLETYAMEDNEAHPERALKAQGRIDEAVERAARRIARVEGGPNEPEIPSSFGNGRFATPESRVLDNPAAAGAVREQADEERDS